VIFNRLNALAETHPTMGQIIGTRGETGSRWALWGVKAYFTGTLAISAVVSPVGTAIALGAGGTTTYALRKADVNDEAAGFYGLVVGIVTGGKVAKSKVVGRWDAAVRGELSGWITGGLKLGKQVMEALGGPRLMNERGGAVVVKEAHSRMESITTKQGAFSHRPSWLNSRVIGPINGQTTTLIGSFKNDMKSILKETNYSASLDFGPKNGGFNILNVPREKYNPDVFWRTYNQPWLKRAIDRGDDVLILSNPHDQFLLVRNGVQTNFSKELNFMKDQVKLGRYRYVPEEGR
jgi:hypothetical protein